MIGNRPPRRDEQFPEFNNVRVAILDMSGSIVLIDSAYGLHGPRVPQVHDLLFIDGPDPDGLGPSILNREFAPFGIGWKAFIAVVVGVPHRGGRPLGRAAVGGGRKGGGVAKPAGLGAVGHSGDNRPAGLHAGCLGRS